MTNPEKLRALLRHIENVQKNCRLIADHLLERATDDNGNFGIARQLMANVMAHDLSKFTEEEWHIFDEDETPEREEALKHHWLLNSHHPEFHGNIKLMGFLDVAEMVSDWKARSEEFGTSIFDWINDVATVRYRFTPEDPVYNQIMDFVNIITVEAFTPAV